MSRTKLSQFFCRSAKKIAGGVSIDFGLLLLRVGISMMMLVHGIPKLSMLLAGQWSSFPDPIGLDPFLSLLLCVLAEVGCSVLLFFGLFTKLASLLLLVNMCAALFFVLALSGWNAQELSDLYLLVYLTLFYTGAGRFSLDALWFRRQREVAV